MNHKRFLPAVFLLGGAAWLASDQIPHLPRNAIIYFDKMARYYGESAPVRVVFYEVRGESVGVTILDARGHQVAGVTKHPALGLYKGTGLYDVTGDGWPKVVMIATEGAKTLQAIIYEYQRRRLREIGRFSGFRIEVVHLRGRPIIATSGEYGTLSDLFLWQNGTFAKVNEHFPEYYRAEIEQQKRIIAAPAGFPVYVIAQACQLAARALIYGKNYAEAKELCLQAFKVASREPGLIANQIDASPEVLSKERKEAEQNIQETLERITKAQQASSSRLPD